MDEPRFDLAALRRYVDEMPPASKPAPKDGRLTVASMMALGAGNGLDAGSTVYALNRGAHETNPVYGAQPNAAKVLAIKGATTAGQLWLLKKMAKSHPKAANALAKISGAAMGVIGVHNLRQASRSAR